MEAKISRFHSQLESFVSQTPGTSPELSTLAADLEKLHGTWEYICATLKDAQEMEIRNDSVKLWLWDLRNLAYDAEDVLDRCNYELLRAKHEARKKFLDASEKLRSGGKRSAGLEEESGEYHIPSSSPFGNVVFLRDVVERVGDIKDRFAEIARKREALHLKEGDGERRLSRSLLRSATSSVSTEVEIFGRDDDLENLVRLLVTKEEGDHDKRSDGGCPVVIAVVGMAGVGKTTLAQHVYNDKRVSDRFVLKGWVHVTDCFDLLEVTRAAVESLTGCRSDSSQLDILQKKLKEVKVHRFLLVLDDVWNENWTHWDTFRSALRDGAKGSKILVTTRNQPVADTMHALQSYPLSCLSEIHCWSLFKQWAFRGHRNPTERPELVEIGKAIVKKCERLPLAVKVLGGFLSRDQSEDGWKDVLESDIWEIDRKQEMEIMGSLQLSYLYLPSELKPCFTYCSVFPKGHIINKDYLIKLWMAQCALGQDKRGKRMEDTGLDYIEELLSRSFFQQVMGKYSRGIDKEHVVMHDLIHDLARQVSREECQSLVIEHSQPLGRLSSTTRHVSFLDVGSCKEIHFPSFHQSTRLRTLLVLRESRWNKHTRIRIAQFGCLRALDLVSRINKDLLEHFIGNLTLICYLDLSASGIKKLCESVCRLYNLQTLDLSRNFIQKLPHSIGNLERLRHLYLQENRMLRMLPSTIGRLHNLQTLDCTHTGIRQYMPKGIGRLIKLQSLEQFHVHQNSNKHAGISELKDMVDLRGDLLIGELRNVASTKEAEAANLKNKKYLTKLVLEWSADFNWSSDRKEELDEEVLEALEPHKTIENLQINSYPGVIFPIWIGHPSYTKLVSVHLSFCSKCKALSCFGRLPSLEFLSIENMTSLKEVVHEFYGCKENSISNPNSFPYRLVIYCCPELTSLRISALGNLFLHDCKKLESIDFFGNFPISVNLGFYNIPRLNLSENMHLPTTLNRIVVEDCPHLRQWCEENRDGKLAYVLTVVLYPTISL